MLIEDGICITIFRIYYSSLKLATLSAYLLHVKYERKCTRGPMHMSVSYRCKSGVTLRGPFSSLLPRYKTGVLTPGPGRDYKFTPTYLGSDAGYITLNLKQLHCLQWSYFRFLLKQNSD